MRVKGDDVFESKRFTLGEWVSTFKTSGGQDGRTSSFDITVKGKVICRVDGIDYGQSYNHDFIREKKEMEANARLISVAPRLAESVYELIQLFEFDTLTEDKKAIVSKAMRLYNQTVERAF